MPDEKIGSFAELQALMGTDPNVRKQVDTFKQKRGQKRYDKWIMSNPKASKEQIEVGKRHFGVVEPKEDVFEETLEKKRAETGAALEKGRFATMANLETIMGAARDFTQVYSEAIKEGGAGGFIQKKISDAAEKVGDLPGGIEIGGRFPASQSIIGKKTEMLTKMMPMLTQQATKPEGSVRLITTVFEALGKTIPDRGTAPRAGRRQILETLRSMFKFARAAENVGRTFDDEFGKSPDDLTTDDLKRVKSWAQQISASAKRIELSPEEQASFDELEAGVLMPLDEILQKRNEVKQERTGLSPEDQAELDAINEELGL